jgi:hypothetical protein
MVMRRDGGGSSKAPTKTKAQIEADERARAAAAKAAADRAAASRQTKAQVERAERAEAERIARIKATGPRGADAMDRWINKPAAKPAIASTTTNNSGSSVSSSRSSSTSQTSSSSSSTSSSSNTSSSTTTETSQSSTPDTPADSSTSSGSSTTTTPPVKSAPIDTVEFVDETFSAELITDLLFEDVGGQEILTIARGDTVNGQDVIYQPFKNLGILQEIYNPTTLLRVQGTSDRFFSNFTISLRDKIPKVGSGEDGKNYKLDLATGEGIIEFINIKPDEQIEVQIISNGIIENIGI